MQLFCHLQQVQLQGNLNPAADELGVQAQHAAV
jgi:hypothetical protein